MTDERTRTDWKAKFETATAETERLATELARATKERDAACEEADRIKVELLEVRDRVSRARIEGMQAAASALLEVE